MITVCTAMQQSCFTSVAQRRICRAPRLNIPDRDLRLDQCFRSGRCVSEPRPMRASC